MKSRTYIIINIIIPLIVGVAIYALYRNGNLLFFTWVEYVIGLKPSLNFSLDLTQILMNLHIPNWIIFSLPDGIWIYVLTSTIFVVWAQKIHLFWLSVPIFLGIGLEIFQLYNLVPGTFDSIDLIFLLSGYALALFLGIRWREKCIGT